MLGDFLQSSFRKSDYAQDCYFRWAILNHYFQDICCAQPFCYHLTDRVEACWSCTAVSGSTPCPSVPTPPIWHIVEETFGHEKSWHGPTDTSSRPTSPNHDHSMEVITPRTYAMTLGFSQTTISTVISTEGAIEGYEVKEYWLDLMFTGKGCWMCVFKATGVYMSK